MSHVAETVSRSRRVRNICVPPKLGADPANQTAAKDARYALPTQTTRRGHGPSFDNDRAPYWDTRRNRVMERGTGLPAKPRAQLGLGQQLRQNRGFRRKLGNPVSPVV